MIPRVQGEHVPKPERRPRFDQVTIGKRMRAARDAKGWSRAEFIRRAGIAMEEDTLRKKEKGENPFYFAELSAFCDALEAPALFPIMDWGEARLADKLLGLQTPTPAGPPVSE
jgi:transcriptional regulator with XRE-family HTH domain